MAVLKMFLFCIEVKLRSKCLHVISVHLIGFLDVSVLEITVYYFYSQMVTRALMDTLRIMGDRQEEITTVLEIMTRLAYDPGELCLAVSAVSRGVDNISVLK